MKSALITYVLFLTAFPLFSQTPVSEIAGYLEVYHPDDTTSMYIGRHAGELLDLQDTSHNIVIGHNTAKSIRNSSNNIIIGERTAKRIRLSNDNVLIGNQIGGDLNITNSTVAIGYRSGALLIGGNHNTLIGNRSGESLALGATNTLIGSEAGRNVISSGNTMVGFRAGASSSNGSSNNFYGYQSGRKNTSGDNNCFYGVNSGSRNTEGSLNIYLGSSAGARFSTGNDNTVIGSKYLPSVSNGSGSQNVLLGNEAGESLIDGSYNTLIGTYAGSYIQGNRNIIIGNTSGPLASNSNLSNRLFIDVARTNKPLIYGEFDSRLIEINGFLKAGDIELNKPSNDDGIIKSSSTQISSDLFLQSNDKVIIDLDSNNDENGSFSIRNGDQQAVFDIQENGNLKIKRNDTTIFHLQSNGNLDISGALTHTSDINQKYDIRAIDPFSILEKISSFDISTWKYKGTTETHLGPMAQDFYAAFGLGGSDTTIATVDADGVALTAIKALSEENRKLQSEILEIKKQLEIIKKMLNEK